MRKVFYVGPFGYEQKTLVVPEHLYVRMLEEGYFDPGSNWVTSLGITPPRP